MCICHKYSKTQSSIAQHSLLKKSALIYHPENLVVCAYNKQKNILRAMPDKNASLASPPVSFACSAFAKASLSKFIFPKAFTPT